MRRINFKDNKGFWIVYIIYIILMIADFTTTFMVGPATQALESNIIYLKTGSFIPIILLNFIALWLFYYMYNNKKTTVFYRFFAINLMLLICAARVLAINNAISWIKNPVSLETAKTLVTTEAKIALQKNLAYMIYAPMVMNVLTFLFWKLDHFIDRRDWLGQCKEIMRGKEDGD